MVPEPNERGLFVCITCVAFSGAFLFLVMPGSVLRFLYGQCCKPSKAAGDSESLGPQGVAAGDSESLGPQGVAAGDSESLGPQGVPAGDSESLGPQGASTATVGVSALAQDLSHFEITSQVPEALSKRVVSAKKAQAKWYRKLSKAWKEAKPPPRTPEEAARIVIQTLKKHRKADVEGLLAFYGLPLPRTPVALSTAAPSTVEFELQTLPVDAKAVHDGDTMTVYVSTISPMESSCIPDDIQMAARQCSEARAERNYPKADALHQKIIHSGYRLINDQNQDILARKYRIRLRGIDAPESSMPYGQQAKEELSKIVQGKCLRILVYSRDNYGRCIGDVYCNGMLVQEAMLKKGFAWQYTAYDQRSELASWEQEARAKQVGLWASSNPEKPWEWRKARRAGHLHKLPPPEV